MMLATFHSALSSTGTIVRYSIHRTTLTHVIVMKMLVFGSHTTGGMRLAVTADSQVRQEDLTR